MHIPTLYLIPVTLGDTPINKVLPSYNTEIINNLSYFIVENIRSARRFLKKCNPAIDINKLTFYELNKHTSKEKVPSFLSPLESGESVGVISEAGCPAIADPGAEVVAIAQSRGYNVIPLVGPSSILMALIASGFNGQCFAFNGYLPIDEAERAKKLKQLEARAYNENQTQIFMETPYRNDKLAKDILRHCKSQTKLCIAMNITCENEYIVTKTIGAWKQTIPSLHKQPCVFLIYKG
ncbi:MAG TPA: SAM-dependent methyltransferase [Dysgonamonadaceae bacterium]|nr:SAM-dependent methyltransferase [Dysgonamonadaceae bacterium]